MSRVAKKPVDLPKGVTVTIGATPHRQRRERLISPGQSRPASSRQQHLGWKEFSGRGSECHRGFHARAIWPNNGHRGDDGLREEARAGRVGYSRLVQAKEPDADVGFSHLITTDPTGSRSRPTQTRSRQGHRPSADRQTAAEIRSFRPPEPYKGKGVKYSDRKDFAERGRRSKHMN